MPVILGRKFGDRWLTPAELTESDRLSMLAPAPEGLLQFWSVGRTVGNTRNERAEREKPIAERRNPLGSRRL